MVVNRVYAIELEVIIICVIIIPDNAIANQELGELNAINVWMGTTDIPRKDVEVNSSLY